MRACVRACVRVRVCARVVVVAAVNPARSLPVPFPWPIDTVH